VSEANLRQGSHILTALASNAAFATVHVVARKDLPRSEKVNVVKSTDSISWPTLIPSETSVFISALGTTARQAGSFAKQREIDYDLNLALIKAAKEKGVRVYVLISTAGASPESMMPYTKMKGELDEAAKSAGFEHTIILKPGLLVGTREDSRPGEFIGRTMASFLGAVSGNMLKDPWAVDAEIVAKAAVAASVKALKGEMVEKVTVLGQKDVLRIGRST